MAEFMTWPDVKKSVFITIGNSSRTPPPSGDINRADVYRHMEKLKEGRELIFINSRPYEKMVWKYVDELGTQRFVEKTRKFEEHGKEHYWFKMTKKGEDLHKRVWFALSFGPDEIINLVSGTAGKEIGERIRAKLSGEFQIGFPMPAMDLIMNRLGQLMEEQIHDERS